MQLGVIDVLQFFDASKQMESMYKSLRFGDALALGGGGGGAAAPPDISAIDPNRYAVRFMSLASRVFSPSEA